MANFGFLVKSSGMDADFLFRNSSAAAKSLHREAKRLKREHDRRVFWTGRKAMKKPPEGGSDAAR